MSLEKLIETAKRIAKEITTQHVETVKIRKRLFKKGTIEDYDKYDSLIAELKRAENHEKELEKQWWENHEKIRNSIRGL